MSADFNIVPISYWFGY